MTPRQKYFVQHRVHTAKTSWRLWDIQETPEQIKEVWSIYDAFQSRLIVFDSVDSQCRRAETWPAEILWQKIHRVLGHTTVWWIRVISTWPRRTRHIFHLDGNFLNGLYKQVGFAQTLRAIMTLTWTVLNSVEASNSTHESELDRQVQEATRADMQNYRWSYCVRKSG